MTVTREKLYEEVWAEPMTKVAARHACRRVSSPASATAPCPAVAARLFLLAGDIA